MSLLSHELQLMMQRMNTSGLQKSSRLVAHMFEPALQRSAVLLNRTKAMQNVPL